MSNYINQNVPGPLRGNPMAGLCEKASISVEKVFSSCLSRETKTNVNLDLISIETLQQAADDMRPASSDLTAPYKFISGTSIGTRIENLVVTDLADDKCSARVECDVIINMEIVGVDANGTKFIRFAEVCIPKDIILKVPAPSLLPYEIKAKATCVIQDGEFTADDVLNATLCVTIIIEVVVQVQLLVPSYGYTHIPPCVPFTQATSCAKAFELPIYPTDCC